MLHSSFLFNIFYHFTFPGFPFIVICLQIHLAWCKWPTPWLMELWGSMPHPQRLSNNPYPEPNQSNSLYWHLFFMIHSEIVLLSMPMPPWRSLTCRFTCLKFESTSTFSHFGYMPCPSKNLLDLITLTFSLIISIAWVEPQLLLKSFTMCFYPWSSTTNYSLQAFEYSSVHNPSLEPGSVNHVPFFIF